MRDQAADGAHQTTQSLPVQAFEGLPADLDSTLLKRQELSLNRRPSYARQRGAAPDFGICGDHLLADIEELVAELRGKLARFVVFRSLHSSDEASGAADEDATEWMHQALEDIAATALGTEVAYHEGVLRKRATAAQDLIVETDQQLESGTAG